MHENQNYKAFNQQGSLLKISALEGDSLTFRFRIVEWSVMMPGRLRNETDDG